MRTYILLILICSNSLLAQKVKNEFFALHNIIRGDSTYNTFDKQVELVKNAGFDGIEINQIESFDGMKSALDQFQFKGSYFYVKLQLGEPIDNRLESAINAMKVDERRSFYGNPITPVPATDAPKTAISAKPIVEAPKVNVTVGTLKLVNSTAKSAQVALNGQAYKVEAGQTVIIPGMPTGEFTYEVTAEDLGVIQAMVSRKLSTAETFTVYIYPR